VLTIVEPHAKLVDELQRRAARDLEAAAGLAHGMHHVAP
jgi:hypothetical protein